MAWLTLFPDRGLSRKLVSPSLIAIVIIFGLLHPERHIYVVVCCFIVVFLNIEHYLVLQKVILLHFPNRFPPFLFVLVTVEV